MDRFGFLGAALAVAAVATPAFSADMRLKAPAAPPAYDRCTKLEPAPGTPEVPGGDLFGFTSPTDIGDPCSYAYASEYTGRSGKRDGSYFAVTSKSQFAYTWSDRVAFAISPFVSTTRWRDVTVAQDALLAEGVALTSLRRMDFDGLSGEVALRLIKRGVNQPVALTVSAEPRWARMDGLTGYRAEAYGVEFKLFADVALSQNLFAAINFNYGFARQRLDIPGATWGEGSSTNVSFALTTRIFEAQGGLVESVFVGAESRFLSAFTGLALDANVGNAWFAGPTIAIGFRGGSMLNAVWTPQVSGRARPPSAPGALDLDNFERHQFRVKYATPLG